MSGYIDADALIEEIERCFYETWSKGVNRTWWAQAVKVKDNTDYINGTREHALSVIDQIAKEIIEQNK
jgi:hypothetical protein